MSSPPKTVITNVRVFDGTKLTEPTEIIIDGDKIGSDRTNAVEIDGGGGVLLPGLIDTHVHISKLENLHQLAKHGITTALDMGAWPPSFVDSIRNQSGVTDIRSAGTPLTAPGSSHSRIPSMPADAMVADATQAAQWVQRRVAEGSDYIKLVADTPGPDQATLNAAALEAKRLGKLSIAHQAAYEPFQMAQKAKVDVITHVPMDKAITHEDAEILLREGCVCSPTLSMMEGVAKLGRPGCSYDYSEESVRNLHKANVPILAGTDANDHPGTPAQIEHGSSLHHELELLVRAGLSNVEALRSATCLAAKHFGLADRGVVADGYRADLLLIVGDPLTAVVATKNIQRVWCAGIEVM